MLSLLGRVLLLRWLFGRRDHRRRGHPTRTYWGGAPSRGYRRPAGRRGGFGMFGPFPAYSGRTRGGTHVSVGGCCLPIPLALSVLLASLARLAIRRR